MDKRGTIQQEKVISRADRIRKRIRISGGRFIAFVIVVILLGATAVFGFSKYINEQLFLDRQTHLLEISEKVSEIIDVVIDGAWGDVQTCEHIMEENGDMPRASVINSLEDMTNYINVDNSTVLAIDQRATYYSSDGHIGQWSKPSDFSSAAPEQQVVVSSLPYHNADDAYMVFIQKLKDDVVLEGSNRRVTHVALAIEIDSLKEAFAVSAFDDKCYTFIVNSEGRRLYKNTQLQEFIDGYNIITAMKDFEVVNGGTIDNLKSAVGNEEQACLEFKYNDKNYYVGTALIPSVNWEVMLFVPTEVLGANTNALLHRTTQYFIMIGVAVMLLLCIALFVFTSSLNDKKLMKQQQESNKLLAKAAEEAEKANKAKSDFLSRMSHDIRTPINGIMGMTDIGIKNIENKVKTFDCFTKIDTASRHLLSLVNDVLDMSSIESGKVMLNNGPINMTAVLNNCASIVNGQLMDRDLNFVKDFGNFEHSSLFGDELRLRQVLINVLGNAVKFTPDDGTVRFFAEEISSEETSATYRFVVEDTGRGMSDDFMKRIFEPFSQEDGHDRSEYQGTGLGMAITKQFVDLMGGKIKVESELYKGSKFTIEITFDIDADNLSMLPEEPILREVAGMKVLLVEDNALNMEIAMALLEEDNIVVTTANNGKEAVDIFSSNPPGTFDAILMDVMMPVMDGTTATREIRALPREDAIKIPIIAMTANAYEEDKQKTRDAGMNEHLSKPIDGYKLIETLSYYYKETGTSVCKK